MAKRILFVPAGIAQFEIINRAIALLIISNWAIPAGTNKILLAIYFSNHFFIREAILIDPSPSISLIKFFLRYSLKVKFSIAKLSFSLKTQAPKLTSVSYTHLTLPTNA